MSSEKLKEIFLKCAGPPPNRLLSLVYVTLYYPIFQVTNTLNDQQLENVTVEVEGENYTVLGYVPCPLLVFNAPGTCYTLLQLPEDPADVASTFTCNLKFLVKDCDPATGEADPVGYEVS